MNFPDSDSQPTAGPKRYPLAGDLLHGLKSLVVGALVFGGLGLVICAFGGWLSCAELPGALRCSPGLF